MFYWLKRTASSAQSVLKQDSHATRPYRWGETMSMNCGHQRAHCLCPRWYTRIKNHGGMILTGENSRFLHQSSLPIIPALPSSTKAGGFDEWNDEYPYSPLRLHGVYGSALPLLFAVNAHQGEVCNEHRSTSKRVEVVLGCTVCDKWAYSSATTITLSKCNAQDTGRCCYTAHIGSNTSKMTRQLLQVGQWLAKHPSVHLFAWMFHNKPWSRMKLLLKSPPWSKIWKFWKLRRSWLNALRTFGLKQNAGNFTRLISSKVRKLQTHQRCLFISIFIF
jgi:hypothetical protein